MADNELDGTDAPEIEEVEGEEVDSDLEEIERIFDDVEDPTEMDLEAPDEPSAEGVIETTIDEGSPIEGQEPIAQDIQAPAFLTADERAGYGQWSEGARGAIDRIGRAANQSVAKAFQQNAEINRVIQSHGDVVSSNARRGEPPAVTLNRLFEWDKHIESDPLAAIAEIAQLKKVSANDLVNYLNGEPQVDPVQSERDERLEALEQAQAQAVAQQEAAQAEVFRSEARAFRQQNDVDGILTDQQAFVEWARDADALHRMHPQKALSEIYAMAYDRITWGNPTRREAMQRRTNELNKLERVKQDKAKLRQANRATAPARGGPAAGESPVIPTDDMELIEAVFNGEIT